MCCEAQTLTPRSGVGQPNNRLVEGLAAHRSEEAGGPEAEEPAVRGHLPVALTARYGGQAHDRLVEGPATHRAEETGVPEGEEAAVGGHLPVAVVVRGGGHPDHRLVERLAAH